MATRTRKAWKIRSDGQYDCRVGWKINSQGRLDQPRFRLGGELREAMRRDQLLRQIWERIEQAQPQPQPLWSDETLALAQRPLRGAAQGAASLVPGPEPTLVVW